MFSQFLFSAGVSPFRPFKEERLQKRPHMTDNSSYFAYFSVYSKTVVWMCHFHYWTQSFFSFKKPRFIIYLSSRSAILLMTNKLDRLLFVICWKLLFFPTSFILLEGGKINGHNILGVLSSFGSSTDLSVWASLVCSERVTKASFGTKTGIRSGPWG